MESGATQGWLSGPQGRCVSCEWLGRSVDLDKRRGGDLHTHLRCQKKRRTRYSIIAKAPDKSAQAVTDALLTALQPHADLVHTLIYDNGKEFACHQAVAKGLDA